MLAQSSAPVSAQTFVFPCEIYANIFKFLTPGELLAASKVCRLWTDVAGYNMLWKPLSEIAWPGCKLGHHLSWKNYYKARYLSDNTRILCTRRGFLYSAEDNIIKIWRQNTIYYAPQHRPQFNLINFPTDHLAPINCLQLQYNSYCKTDPRIVTASADTTIKIWKRINDVNSALFSCTDTLTGHTDSVTALTVDGDLIFSGSADKTIRVWQTNFSTGVTKLLHVLEGHAGTITSLQIGKRDYRRALLYSAAKDKTMKVWNVFFERQATCEQVLEGFTGYITGISASIYDRFVVCGSEDRKIIILEKLLDGALKFVTSFEGHTKAIRCIQKIRFSPYILSASDDGSVKIWKKRKRENNWRFKGFLANQDEPIRTICLDYAFRTPASRKIYTQGRDKAIKVWISHAESDHYEILTELREPPAILGRSAF